MPFLLFPGGPATPGVDIANVIGDILPALGAANLGDLDWCTQAELYQFADEANKRLAARAGVWVERYGAQDVPAGAAVQPAPAGHVDTIHVSFSGSPLRPASARELASLDANWPAAQNTPKRFSMDAGAPGTITLYPNPSAPGTMATIYHRFQPTIQSGSSLVPIASPVQDYFAYAMLAEARRKESDAAMPEMAEHFAQRLELYAQVLTRYFGESE
jgi:hypothetical protein